MNNKRKAILEKIAKLQKHANSAENIGNLDEAQAAAGRVTSLMQKYNIELAELILEEDEKLPIDGEGFDFAPYWKRNESYWLFSLMGVICRANLTRTVGFGVRGAAKSSYRCIIYGQEHNISTVIYLFDSIHTQIRYLEKIAWKEYQGPDKRNTFIRSYHQGAIWGLASKFDDIKQSIKEEHGEHGLMVIDNAMKEVDEHYDKLHSDAKQLNGRASSSGAGIRSGMAAGKRVSINKGNLSNAIKSKRIG